MTQPVPYTPSYNFTDYQSANPSDPLPGDSLDVQLSAISTFAQQVCASIGVIQRDDGALANNIVTLESLSSSLAVLMALDKFVVKGAWVTATSYAVGDVVTTTTSGTYVAATAHVAGVFATDLAAGKWLLLATTGASTADSFTPTGSSAPANGMYLPAANVVGFAANSLDVLRLSAVASAVNYFRMQNSAGSDALQLSAQGSASNIDLQLVPKGTGRVVAPELILTAPLAVAQGGTGATSAAAARTALGVVAIGDIPFTAASASGPASFDFAEDTDNGTNKVTLKAPASLAADGDIILPGAAGTLATLAGTETLANKTLDSTNTFSGTFNSGALSGTITGAASFTGASLFSTLDRLGSTLTKTSDTTFADIPGMSWSLLAGASYRLDVVGYISQAAAGGNKTQTTYSGSITTMFAHAKLFNNGSGLLTNVVASGVGTTGANSTTGTLNVFEYPLFITPATSGTFTLQGAQQASNATPTAFNGFSGILRRLS